MYVILNLRLPVHSVVDYSLSNVYTIRIRVHKLENQWIDTVFSMNLDSHMFVTWHKWIVGLCDTGDKKPHQKQWANRNALMTMPIAGVGKGGGLLEKPVIERTTPGRESEFNVRYGFFKCELCAFSIDSGSKVYCSFMNSKLFGYSLSHWSAPCQVTSQLLPKVEYFLFLFVSYLLKVKLIGPMIISRQWNKLVGHKNKYRIRLLQLKLRNTKSNHVNVRSLPLSFNPSLCQRSPKRKGKRIYSFFFLWGW